MENIFPISDFFSRYFRHLVKHNPWNTIDFN